MPAGPRRASAGLVLPVLLLVVFALTLAWLGSWNAALTLQIASSRAARDRTRLEAARQILGDWYLQHLPALDTPGAPLPDPAAALATLAGAAGIQVEVSDPQSDPEAPARVVVAWIPDALRAPRAHFDPASASLVGGGEALLSARVDGREIERAALRRAERQLREVAAALERWFAARVADDPLHRLDRNYFQPLDSGCLPAATELPCLPDYAPVAQSGFWQRALDLQPAALTSPWGANAPVEASAGTDASARPPFSLALRIRTPWGRLIQARAVEPGT